MALFIRLSASFFKPCGNVPTLAVTRHIPNAFRAARSGPRAGRLSWSMSRKRSVAEEPRATWTRSYHGRTGTASFARPHRAVRARIPMLRVVDPNRRQVPQSRGLRPAVRWLLRRALRCSDSRELSFRASRCCRSQRDPSPHGFIPLEMTSRARRQISSASGSTYPGGG